MRTPDQAKWDFVQQWLDRAHRDLRVAAMLLKEASDDYEIVGFHAQQAAEKFIKAFLVRHQVKFPKTHNITSLRQLVAQVDQALADRLASADVLTPYGVATFPNHRIAFTRRSQSRNCGVADVVPEPGHDVWGAVYEIDERDIASLAHC